VRSISCSNNFLLHIDGLLAIFLSIWQGFNPKKAKKTGTTIAGIIFKDGVVLGADTRATSGPIVADKNCEKIHYLAPNIFCCGAGTSADCDSVTEMMSSNLTLHRLSTGVHLPCFCLQLALPPE
jgi:20S proteasome alpha/beta subunit